MKMKDSMDQMKFDRGNPQEDAPRRVQKRKKLNWKPVWFAVTAAVLAAVLLVAVRSSTAIRNTMEIFGSSRKRDTASARPVASSAAANASQ